MITLLPIGSGRVRVMVTLPSFFFWTQSQVVNCHVPALTRCSCGQLTDRVRAAQVGRVSPHRHNHGDRGGLRDVPQPEPRPVREHRYTQALRRAADRGPLRLPQAGLVVNTPPSFKFRPSTLSALPASRLCRKIRVSAVVRSGAICVIVCVPLRSRGSLQTPSQGPCRASQSAECLRGQVPCGNTIRRPTESNPAFSRAPL